MNIKQIAVELIDVPEFYFRQDDPITLKKLENSIRTFGLIRPIVVREVGSRYELVEGRQILKVVHMLGENQIFCVVLDSSSDTHFPTLNLVLNITHPQESLAKIAHFIKERSGVVGESAVGSILPYSIDEIQRFIEICTFDWAQFEKKQNAGHVSMFDSLDEPQEIQPIETHVVTPEPVEQKITYVELSEKEKEENNTHESEDKILVKSEDVTSSLRAEILKEKKGKKKAEPKKTEPKVETKNLFE